MSWKNSVPEGEQFTYDYFFLDYVCRLCWGADGIVELSSFNPKSIENDATIAEKIQECIGIDVTTHTHPKKVCSKCLDEVEIFTDFKRFCQETNRKLHSILENGTTLQNIQPTEAGRKRKLDQFLILKQESDFSNLEIDDSIDDLFDNLPLSCELSRALERPVKKERKKWSTNYCNTCHLNLESAEKLTEHNLECHGIEENGLYKCFGCEKRFKSLKKRLRHESETCKELKSGYKCNICDRYLPKRRVYEHHMRAHRENKEIDLSDENKCNKCKETFESIESLRKHMLDHYQKQKKTYVCDTCGRVFSRRDYLHKHKLVHEGSKLQKCPHCDYSAVQRSSLTVHIRKHTGERPYPCDLCPHRCVTSSNLREHRKRHFGIKAFECQLCDKKFGYKISLEEHMSAVHERSETHACAQCGATYSRFRGLRRHLLAKHGKKVKKIKDDLIEVQNGQVAVENTQPEAQNDSVQNDQISVQNSQISVQNSQVSVQNSQISVQNSQISVQNGQVRQNIQAIVQNSQMQSEGKRVIKMTVEFKDSGNVEVVKNTDGVVYMT